MRTIQKIYSAVHAPIGDLNTHTAIPQPGLLQIDPFILLNHHGPQIYSPGNNGLPFGPHPHRGMETVTFIIQGDIMHKDSTGSESVISEGGVQWMCAGSGLIHAEISSEEFKKNGGPLEILQLWLNLPASSKMTKPYYKGLQKGDIRGVTLDNGKINMNLISGNWSGIRGEFDSIREINLATIEFNAGSHLNLEVPKENNILFYVVSGSIVVNDQEVKQGQLADFKNDDFEIDLKSEGRCILLFGYAEPLNEPFFSHGPFVMNTEEEIKQAYEDYQNGKFGKWEF